MNDAIMVGQRVHLRPHRLVEAPIFAAATAAELTTQSKTGRLPLSPLAFEYGLDGGVPAGPPATIDFAVARVKDDRLLGSVALLEIDWVNRTAETATYLLGEEVRGRGYGTEAKMLLLEYAFDRIQLHVVRSWAREGNARSIAALLRQGYRPAGRRFRGTVQGGVYVDHLIFDLLRDEWLLARDAWRLRNAERDRDRER